MSRENLNIGIISSMFSEINGTAKATRQLAFGLAKRGHQVHIYAPNKPINWDTRKNPLKEKMHYHEFFAIRPPYEQEFRISIPLVESLSVEFRRDAKELDHIHTQTPCGMGFFGFALARWYHIPDVVTAHSPLFFYTPLILGNSLATIVNPPLKCYEQNFYNRFDLRSTPTKSKKEFLIEEGLKEPIAVISNGIEEYFFQHGNGIRIRDKWKLGDKKVLMYLSRLSEEKHQDMIIRAFTNINKRFPHSHLLIAGQGPLRSKLEALVKELDLWQNVTFTGFIPEEEILDYYAAADCTTLWSNVEAQGLVLLEAMAQGTPSIGLNAMGIKDVIKNGKTGFLVDNLKQFTDRVVELFRDDQLSFEFHKNCLTEIQKHRIENIIFSWERVYHFQKELHGWYLHHNNEERLFVYERFLKQIRFIEY